MLYPLTFVPRFKERVWGGRALGALFGKALPPDAPIGESWEISDRPGDESVIANGPFEGRTLRWLMAHHGDAVLGAAAPAPEGRFPLLCKILDARDKLSLQVHPPSHKALELGGEPKTEMWFIAAAATGAELFVGLRRGITRGAFEARLAAGDVSGCFHRIPVHAGDAMFLPSGRVHAIGGGLVIFEIQQNSDTTYRVFDWNRTGLDGKARELHVPQSLASIDFEDFEPGLVDAPVRRTGAIERRRLVRDPLFGVEWVRARGGAAEALPAGLHVVAIVSGEAHVRGNGVTLPLRAGEFALLPASLRDAELDLQPDAACLIVDAGTPAQ